MPLTNVSVLKLSINGWFSPGYVSCTNFSIAIARVFKESFAFCARHLCARHRIYAVTPLLIRRSYFYDWLVWSLVFRLRHLITPDLVPTPSRHHPICYCWLTFRIETLIRIGVSSNQSAVVLFEWYFRLLLTPVRIAGSAACWSFPPSLCIFRRHPFLNCPLSC